MPRDPRYDILFEPVRIGPVTARNRFFQVPHCNGMGHAMPEAHAAMREVKAEGGWAVVSTEECEIHPSGDVSPYVEARLCDDQDIPALALMCCRWRCIFCSNDAIIAAMTTAARWRIACACCAS